MRAAGNRDDDAAKPVERTGGAAGAGIRLFGARARVRRIALGMTQEEVADRACADQSSIGRIERGERDVTYATLVRISWALEIHPRHLLKGPRDGIDLSSRRERPGAASPSAGSPFREWAGRASDHSLVRVFGARLKRRRMARKLSQQKLGDLVGVQGSYIGQVERGESNVRFSSLAKIARGLGCAPSELFGEPGEPAR